MDRWIKKIVRQISLEVFIVLCLFLVSIFIFALIANEAVVEKEDSLDKSISIYFVNHAGPGLIQVMKAFSILGSIYFLLPAYIVLVTYFFEKKNFRYAIHIAVIGISSFIMMQLLKSVFHRQRPAFPFIDDPNSYSFPSGHALSSFVFFSILSFLVWSGRWRTMWKSFVITLLFVVTLLVGVSRIVLNVHYTTDVIAGFCLGVSWVILSFWIIKKTGDNKR